MMHSSILDGLYKKYNIANLSFGIVHDKLGDLYEEYCLLILNNDKYLCMAKALAKSMREALDIL